MKKIASRRIQEKNRDSRKPRAPRITSSGKQDKARACDGGARSENRTKHRRATGVHDRAPQGKSRQPASKMARPSRARQHDHAAQHGLVMLGGTAVLFGTTMP